MSEQVPEETPHAEVQAGLASAAASVPQPPDPEDLED
jgi:hypothetical protein